MLAYYLSNVEVPDEIIDRDIIEKFSDIDSADKFIKKHTLVRSESISSNVLKNYTVDEYTESLRTPEPSIAINHIEDYYLKLYTRIMSGLDFEEDVFQLTDDTGVSVFPGTDREPFLGQNEFNELFDSFLNGLITSLNLSPEEEVSIRNNTYRLKTEAKRSIFFAPFKYMYKAIRTKIFDRVFSILVDEYEENFIAIEDITSAVGEGIVLDNFTIIQPPNESVNQSVKSGINQYSVTIYTVPNNGITNEE